MVKKKKPWKEFIAKEPITGRLSQISTVKIFIQNSYMIWWLAIFLIVKAFLETIEKFVTDSQNPIFNLTKKN
ncbi:hypothetical protein AAX19_01485 [Oenococcus oeni]|nr:hypothetical protein AAX19_01485 [Oenococcus oeni]